MPTDPEQRPVVFVITRGDSVGGAQIHVRDLAARLVADGTRTVVLVGSTGPFTRALTARGVRWRLCPGLARSINPLRDIRAVREVHRALLIERPRLVSTHTAKAGLVGRLAACWSGVPALFTAHGWQFAPGIPRAQRLLVYTLELILSRLPQPAAPVSAQPSPRRTSPPLPRVITVSRFDYRLARRSAAVPASGLRLVYNGLPQLPQQPPLPNPVSRRPPDGVEFSGPTLIMVARFQAQKDHESLIRALALVDGPWRLQLVGEAGPRFDSMRQLAHSFGFLTNTAATTNTAASNRRIDFLGHRDDVAAVLAAADVYCLISHWEGLPRSIIEAMRAGLPVVASDVGGTSELVRDGVTGYLVPRLDVSALGARLRYLLQNPAERARMGNEGLCRYRSMFTFDAMYRHTLAVWREWTVK